jgi:hypothetical protein
MGFLLYCKGLSSPVMTNEASIELLMFTLVSSGMGGRSIDEVTFIFFLSIFFARPTFLAEDLPVAELSLSQPSEEPLTFEKSPLVY